MRLLIIVLVTTGGLVACTAGESNPFECKSDGTCDDPDRPFCDELGVYPASQGIENTCIAQPDKVYCEITDSWCESDTFYKCVAGDFAQTQSCHHGCADSEAQCKSVVPSNGLADYMAMTFLAPEVSMSTAATIDTDTGTLTEGSMVLNVPSFGVAAADNGGVPLTVFVVKSWSSQQVTVEGDAALAIISGGDVQIKDVFDIQEAGHWLDVSCAPSWGVDECTHPSMSAGGQGNAGFGGSGSIGSGAGVHASLENEPLRGGCGQRSAGALQITSDTQIELFGKIHAMGFGGQWSSQCANYAGHASGGGAGGSVLLEAPTVLVSNGDGISANGGSGACLSENGERGSFSTIAAIGACGGDGGNGGSPANNNGGSGFNGGAGGGGVGLIKVNTQEPFEPELGSMFSPAPNTGAITIE